MIVVGDIGGTHARFARVVDGALTDVQVQRCADSTDLTSALESWITACDAPEPTRIVLAVAGPVRDGEARITNNTWRSSEAALGRHWPGCDVRLLNDFEAIAAGIPALDAGHLAPIGERAMPDVSARPARFAVLGPGTGLGAAALLRGRHGDEALASEAGHLPIGWRDDAQRLLLAPHAAPDGVEPAWDHLASGHGIVRIAAALGLAYPSAEAVYSAARDADLDAARCLQHFHWLLGRAAQSLVLATGAWDGLLLCGGLLGEHVDLLVASEFEAAFETHGAHGALMESVPMGLVTHPQPGLLGAARIATRNG